VFPNPAKDYLHTYWIGKHT